MKNAVVSITCIHIVGSNSINYSQWSQWNTHWHRQWHVHTCTGVSNVTGHHINGISKYNIIIEGTQHIECLKKI